MKPVCVRGFVCVVVGLVLVAGAARAQSESGEQAPAASAPTLRVSSNLVVLDVVVTDKRGNVVRDLRKDEFVVYENGVRQTVHTFETPGEQGTPPETPVRDRNGHPVWGTAPITVIVLDQLNTPIEEIGYAREQLFKYLEKQPALLPEPTELIELNDSGVQKALPATRDRDALLNAAKHLHVALPFRLKRGVQSELLLESFALLRQIALASKGDRGRKNVLWVGRGFPSLDPQALDPHEQEQFLNAVRSTVDLMLDARVTLSKIDPRTNLATAEDGDPSDPTQPSLGEVEDPFATTFAFGAFIAQTGGKNFMYMNDLDREIAQGAEQGSSFYTLSYVPTNAVEDGKYRKIDVRLTRPGLEVRTKQGYYAGAPKEQPSDRELGFDMLQAAVSGMQYTGVGVRLLETNTNARSRRLDVRVAVDTGNLPFAPAANGAERTTLFVAVAALDAKGKVLAFKTSSPEVEIPATQIALTGSGHTSVTNGLVVPAKAVAVRVIVRDGEGRIGTADVDPAAVAQVLGKPAAK